MSECKKNPLPTNSMRREEDFLGAADLPCETLYGIHTVRAMANFPLSGQRVHPALIHAYGYVKAAAAQTNRNLGVWAEAPVKADAIEAACIEMTNGALDTHILVDALQGGAGTSTNMNINEVLANRALQLAGRSTGSYDYISPLNDINLHQSTNDTYPTALKLAAIMQIKLLEESLSVLVEAFQAKEQELANVLKIGRTQLQDAIPITLGREMAAYAAAFGRDRWRLSKCEERLRVVNLGGTAIGTGLGAPREYIFRVTETLRILTGVGLARAEDLVENTQNADVFVEVSGFLKTCASNLIKCATDLRLMSSGPDAGFGEIKLPSVQAGSSIMPGKINPVIPEAVTQAAMRVYGYDHQIGMAAAAGNLELNAFMPLIADSLLKSIDLLRNAIDIFRKQCVTGIKANTTRCYACFEGSTTLATALISIMGYEKAAKILAKASTEHKTIRDIILDEKVMTEDAFNTLITAENLMKLGNV